MMLSLAHNHIVDNKVDNGIEVQIERNTNECIICASHFKISVSSDTDSTPLTLYWESVEPETQSAILTPQKSVKNNRAPPIV
jgi:hypothetical protein